MAAAATEGGGAGGGAGSGADIPESVDSGGGEGCGAVGSEDAKRLRPVHWTEMTKSQRKRWKQRN